jgi:hypothetical protein
VGIGVVEGGSEWLGLGGSGIVWGLGYGIPCYRVRFSKFFG